MTTADDLPAGWLTQFRRGVVSGVGVLLGAVILVAIPTFLAWFVPGADSTSASSAARAATIIALAAHHGGMVLDGTPITLTPLAITAVLAALVGVHARRPESTAGFVGFASGYVLGATAAASWARLGGTHVDVGRTAVATLAFVVIVGGLSRSAPELWGRVSQRWRGALLGGAAAASLYVAAGALVAAGSLMIHLHQATLVQSTLAPGIGGAPVAFLGVAAAPNAALAGVGYLTGPGFSIGSHTSVSLLGVQHSRLPLFPMLAAVPVGNAGLVVGAAAAAVTALAAGWVAARLTSNGENAGTRCLGVVLAALVAGAFLAVLAELASGSLGPGSLHHVGVTGWLVGLTAAGLVWLTGSGFVGVDVLRHRGIASAETANATATASASARTDAGRGSKDGKDGNASKDGKDGKDGKATKAEQGTTDEGTRGDATVLPLRRTG